MSDRARTTNKYQLTGIDNRTRGFSRHAEVTYSNGLYCVVVAYEALQLQVEGCKTETAALSSLVRQLHDLGYTQLQTRLQFQGDQYLGSREIWVEHPDPQAGKSLLSATLTWIRRLFGNE